MNADGEQDSSAVYKLYPWDTVENIKMNNAFLVKILDANKNFASVKFSMIHTMDTKAMKEKATGGLELVTEGDTSIKNDVKLDRVTTIFKSSLAVKDSAFILNSMYLSFIKIIC
jgi:hypothetical protein